MSTVNNKSLIAAPRTLKNIMIAKKLVSLARTLVTAGPPVATLDVPASQLKPGDKVFFGGYKNKKESVILTVKEYIPNTEDSPIPGFGTDHGFLQFEEPMPTWLSGGRYKETEMHVSENTIFKKIQQ